MFEERTKYLPRVSKLLPVRAVQIVSLTGFLMIVKYNVYSKIKHLPFNRTACPTLYYKGKQLQPRGC